MKNYMMICIMLLAVISCRSESELLRAENGIEAKIIENSSGGNGKLSISNKGNEPQEVLLLKAKPGPETRGPITLKQFDKIIVETGQDRSISISDTKGTIYGIGVINKNSGEPFKIHAFGWGN